MSTTFSSAPASVSREYKLFTPDNDDNDTSARIGINDVEYKGDGF